MKLKNKLALGLAGLTLALGLGCPVSRSHQGQNIEPSPYTFYLDEQEIKDRFVEGENVDVSQALNYNPIPNNPLTKALHSYLSPEKSLQTARTIYVQYGGTNNFPTFSGLEQAVAVTNQYSDASEILIGEGIFGDGDKFIRTEKPLKITGEGIDKTTIKYLIFPIDYIELSNTRMEGARLEFDDGNDTLHLSLEVTEGGYIHNNLFYGENSAIAIDPFYDMTIENNTFDKVVNPIYKTSIYIQDIETEEIHKNMGDIIIRYNLIKDTPTAMILDRSADCGVNGDLGNNMFLDVGTVVYNPYNYPQGFVGNAWATTTQN